jgi:NADPH-dependent ferric siderophore reductase
VRRSVNHEADVLRVERLSPSFVRIELGGPGLRDWDPLGVPDEGCLFRFPGDEQHPAPAAGRGRWYTVRDFDPGPGRMTVDFMTHPGGPGGEWAAAAEPGDRLRIRLQDSWYEPPEGIRWQWLIGDVVGVPAFARIAQETADRIATRAVIEVPEAGDQQPLDGAEVTWLHTPGLTSGVSGLAEAVRGLSVPEGPGYVYVAGEAAVTRDVKRHLRHELRLPAESYHVIGYWRAAA